MINLTKNMPIVRSDDPITLVGGGLIMPEDLKLALIRTQTIVAADGGAIPLVENGRIPDAVIGDFDSLEPRIQDLIPSERQFPIKEQDSTDFDKALRSIDTPLVLGIGFLGHRLDHQLAVLNTLVRQQDRPCVLLGAHEVVFHAPPRLALNLSVGDIVSLFPLERVTGRSKGLEWPIDGLVFEPGGQIGTSNRVIAEVELNIDGPGMIVMVPRGALEQVMQVFQSEQTGRWPSRAG